MRACSSLHACSRASEPYEPAPGRRSRTDSTQRLESRHEVLMEPAGVALCVSGKFGGQSSGAGALGQRHCPKVHKAGAAALAREVLESLAEIKSTVQAHRRESVVDITPQSTAPAMAMPAAVEHDAAVQYNQQFQVPYKPVLTGSLPQTQLSGLGLAGLPERAGHTGPVPMLW